MKITVINGNMRRGSTWHCANKILEELSKYDEIETSEFFLPKDMPHFCNGCFSCFYNGEDTCPHVSSVTPIVKALVDADLIILTSPVYGLDVSGQMKALVDHLCWMWMSHRPNPKMFNKIGLTVTTTAGMGLGRTAKTMRNSLTFWGVKKSFSFKGRVSAMKWSDVSEKTMAKVDKETAALAKKIAKAVKNIKKLPNPLFRSLMFKAISGMQKKNDWNPTDRNHWEAQGWLTGTKPFRQADR
jgi:multimeric flavodoxin WrbA